MRYTILYPRQELKDFVSHFWITSMDVHNEEINSTSYLTACSLANLVFVFRENENYYNPAFTFFQGQTSIHKELPIPKKGFYKIFGISIYSYAIPHFFNAVAAELSCQSVPLSNLWGNHENLLSEMMAASLASDKCISILSDYLQSQLIDKPFKDETIIKAINKIRHDNGNINLVKLSYELSLSQKQFTRRFNMYVGFNPKLYARIVRFESVLYKRMEYSSLTEAAFLNGYYDQAHFIQDFRDFTGHSPNKFFSLADL